MSAALRAQEQLALDIVDLESDAKLAASEIKDRMEELEEMIENGKRVNRFEKEKAELQQAYDELVTAEGTYMKPQLIAQIRYLRYMLLRADQQPGEDAYQRYEELKSRWEQLQGKLASMDQLEIKVGD